MVAAFIDDGYTETAHIAAAEGIYPAVSFRFRPVTAGAFSEYARNLEASNAAETKQVTAELLASKLIDWDVRSDDGSQIAITVENVLKLKHVVYLKVFQIVIGEEPTDANANRHRAEIVPETDLKN